MQDQSGMKKYWSKDNYFKSSHTIKRSTIKQSVKGICTNIWFKLGGQSILNKKASSQFQSLVMLGKKYGSYENAHSQFVHLFWFTYRKEVKLPSEIKSDLGWGCLIRVGQMLLANSLKRFFTNKNAFSNQQNLIFSFLEDSQGTHGNYSFERILLKGQQRFNLKAGDWFNISQICYVLMLLQNSSPMKGSEEFKMIYFNQTLILIDQVFKKVGIQICQCKDRKICCQICNGSVNYKKKNNNFNFNCSEDSNSFEMQFQHLNLDSIEEPQKRQIQQNQKQVFFYEDQNQIQDADEDEDKGNQDEEEGNPYEDVDENGQKKQLKFDLLLVVSTRISQGSIDAKNFQGVLQLINLPTNMGIIGGVPGKGLYFVGACDQNLIYLDPHLVQSPVDIFNLSKQIQTFHCQSLRLIGRQKIDSSIAFAFYLRNLDELNELIQTIQKIKKQNPEAVPISYMWQNQFRNSGEIVCSNEYEIEECSPDFSFIA